MRAFVCCLLAGMISLPVSAVEPVGDEKQPVLDSAEHEPSVWMRKKLDYSQALLKGLAMADYKQIKVNGARMRLLSKVEGFVRSKNSRYTLHLRRFENICDEIVREAGEENLSGVTLAFNQLTVNCVNCHRSLRIHGEPAVDSTAPERPADR